MYSIPAPLDSFAEIYTACVMRRQSASLRTHLISERQRVLQRADYYQAAADNDSLWQVEEDDEEFVSAKQLETLYTDVLVKGGERHRYLALRANSLHSKCPFCGQRDVQTLDHYLPKENYPEFALLPCNLIPCCFACNKSKHTFIADSYEEQLFHPFFDDWSEKFLVADVQCTQNVTVAFHIAQGVLSPATQVRAQHHFQKMQLAELYSSNASVELVQCRSLFVETFTTGGAHALRQELLHIAASRRTPFINAWQPALYSALASSPAFYSGGFYLIEH